MSTDQPRTPASTASTPSGTPPTSAAPGETTNAHPTSGTSARTNASGDNPLRGSRTSGTWMAVLVLVVVLILLAVFILQNTQKAQVSFFGWSGQAPVSALLLIAAAGGALLVAAAGALRILQLRRRVKRELKAR